MRKMWENRWKLWNIAAFRPWNLENRPKRGHEDFPAARALVFYGAYGRARALGRRKASRSLALAAWKATRAAEGPSWRAERLERMSQRGRCGPSMMMS